MANTADTVPIDTLTTTPDAGGVVAVIAIAPVTEFTEIDAIGISTPAVVLNLKQAAVKVVA